MANIQPVFHLCLDAGYRGIDRLLAPALTHSPNACGRGRSPIQRIPFTKLPRLSSLLNGTPWNEAVPLEIQEAETMVFSSTQADMIVLISACRPVCLSLLQQPYLSLLPHRKLLKGITLAFALHTPMHSKFPQFN